LGQFFFSAREIRSCSGFGIAADQALKRFGRFNQFVDVDRLAAQLCGFEVVDLKAECGSAVDAKLLRKGKGVKTRISFCALVARLKAAKRAVQIGLQITPIVSPF
jgi:hypothetical protein